MTKWGPALTGRGRRVDLPQSSPGRLGFLTLGVLASSGCLRADTGMVSRSQGILANTWDRGGRDVSDAGSRGHELMA